MDRSSLKLNFSCCVGLTHTVVGAEKISYCHKVKLKFKLLVSNL